MRAKFGAIITEGAGKLGGVTVTKGRTGAVVSVKRTAKTLASAGLQSQNQRFSAIRSTWNNLSLENHAAWNNEQFAGKSGFLLFSHINLYMLLAGKSMLLLPVSFVSPALTNALRYIVCLPRQIFLIDYPVIISNNQVLLIYASPVHQASRIIRHSEYRLLGAFDCACSFPLDLSVLYAAQFPGVSHGAGCVSVKYILIDYATGGISQPLINVISLNSELSIMVGTAGTKAALYRSNDFGFSFTQSYLVASGASMPSMDAVSNKFVVFNTSTPVALYAYDITAGTTAALSLVNVANLALGQPRLYGNVLLFFQQALNLFYIFSGMSGLLSNRSLPFSFSSSSNKVLLPDNNVLASQTTGSSVAAVSLCSSFARLFANLPANYVSSSLVQCGNGNIAFCSLAPFTIYIHSSDLVYLSTAYTSAYTVTGFTFTYIAGGIIFARIRTNVPTTVLLISRDFGQSWSVLDTFSTGLILQPYTYRNGNLIFVPMWTGFAGAFSSDGGSSFSLVALPSGVTSFRSCTQVRNDLIYACAIMSSGYAAIYISTDFGQSWTLFYQFDYNTGAYWLSVIPNLFY